MEITTVKQITTIKVSQINFFGKPSCSKARQLLLFLHQSGFVRAITFIFIDGFQNYLTQLLSLRRRSAIRNIFIGRLKVKVTPKGHINYLVHAVMPIFIHGFQNNFAQVFSLRST